MLGTLIESGSRHARRPAASVISVVVHAALITGAVLATEQLSTSTSATTEVALAYIAPRAPPTPAAAMARLPRGFQILIAPVSIPDVLPSIDLTRTLTNPDAFTGVGVPGGVPDGTPDALPVGVFTPDQVERVARLVPGSGTPQYPEVLRSAGIEGDVDLEFVIDTTGRAELRTVRVVSSTHQRFTDAAVRALTRARFVPAELDGRPVRQLVRMPFGFKLNR
jgi:protein TonB